MLGSPEHIPLEQGEGRGRMGGSAGIVRWVPKSVRSPGSAEVPATSACDPTPYEQPAWADDEIKQPDRSASIAPAHSLAGRLEIGGLMVPGSLG